jgi:hypothetical protein
MPSDMSMSLTQLLESAEAVPLCMNRILNNRTGRPPIPDGLPDTGQSPPASLGQDQSEERVVGLEPPAGRTRVQMSVKMANVA